MPLDRTVAGVQGQDGGQVEVVAPSRAAMVAVPRRPVAGADVEQFGGFVVRHRVPNGPAAARDPPLAGPRPGRSAHRVALEAEGGVPGHRMGAPELLSGLGFVGGHVAAHTVLGAPVSDDDRAARDPGRTGHCIVGAGRGRLRDPPHRSVGPVEGDQAAVQQARVDQVAVKRDAPVDVAAAGARPPVFLVGDRRVPAPDLFAGGRIQGEDEAEGAGSVENAVGDQGGGLQPRARLGDLPAPGEAESVDVVRVDLVEGTVPCLRGVASVVEPRGLRGRGAGLVRCGGRRNGCGGQGEHRQGGESAVQSVAKELHSVFRLGFDP